MKHQCLAGFRAKARPVHPFYLKTGANDGESEIRKVRDEVLASVSQKAKEAAARVEELQEELDQTQALLKSKEEELKESQTAWYSERGSLTSRIDELDMFEKSAQKSQEREEILTEEVTQIRAQLNQTETSLKTERQKAEALRSRLDTTNDQLEFEQMRFLKEKDQLNQELKSLQRKLFNYDKEMTVSQLQYDTSRRELEEGLRTQRAS
jgi:chromosome segregation ATPase